jgi:phosphohistidine phosphatase
MNLFLLRHGEAESVATAPEGRQLTEYGHQEVINVARQFAARNLSIDTCYVSPALRAQQTADTFLSQIFQAPAPVTMDVLDASHRAADVMAALKHHDSGNILLVSHNPLLSELLSLLTDGNIDHLHILGTGNLACVSLDIIGLGMGPRSFLLEPDAAAVAAN